MSEQQKYAFETLQVHAGQEQPDPATDARAVPIYLTSSYVFKDAATAAGRFGLTEPGNIYSRLTNPTVSTFEERVAALEGGVGSLGVATGSAAITIAVQNIATAGDHIVSSTDVLDLKAWADIAHRHNVPLIVDATFSTPYLLRPIEHGADVVVHSATKFIGGHGTAMGGVITDAGTFDWAANADKFPGVAKPNPSYHGVVFTEAAGPAAYITKARATLLRDQGATLSPFNAWLLLLGLETLSLRVDRHVENALKVGEFLNNHPQVASVNHPALATGRAKELYDEYYPNGAGSIFTFDVKGTADDARKFTESLSLFSLLANVADVKSLVIHPASTTHSQLTEDELLAAGIKPTTVRLSIGTENIDDIIADLAAGFEAIK